MQHSKKLLQKGAKNGRFQDAAHFLKNLAHPVRLSILCELMHRGETSVGELVASQKLVSQSQVSQFLAKMKSEGLITSRKEAQFVHYSIKSEAVKKLIQSLDKIFCTGRREHQL